MPPGPLSALTREERQDRADRLQAELAAATVNMPTVPAGLRIHPVVAGDCADVLADALNDCDAPGNPMFVALDSYGGPDIPFTLLQLVPRNESSEVLLTIQPQILTRHGQRDAHRANGGPSPLPWTQCLKAARSVGSSSYGFDSPQLH